MATTTLDPSSIPIGADAKLRVTVETGTQPMEVSSGSQQQDKAGGALKSILGSLAETRKYIPEQVYTFLDSMEGKTLDDLRVEAMSLAAKAQEEAKKRASDVTNMGKSVVDNANNKVQDVTDMARERTNSMANEIVQRVVQQPVNQTKEITRSLFYRALSTGQDLAQRGWNVTQQQVVPRVTPYVAPVATKVRQRLPETAETFLKQNVDGKTFDELKNLAILKARRNLLKIEKKDQPTLQQFATEVRQGVVSGQIFWNAFLLAENAASKAFGESKDVPKDASALRRVYNLSTKVTSGVKDMANKQIDNAKQQAMDMASSRLNMARDSAKKRAEGVKNSVMQPVNNVKEAVAPVAERVGATVAPIAERVGQTPVIPSVVYKVLRGPSEKEDQSLETENATEKSTTETQKVTTVPTTTVRVDVVGVQPMEGATITSPPSLSTIEPSAPVMEGSTSSFGGNTASMDLKDMASSTTVTSEIKNTNASSIGNLGSAGMGVTTTGSEAPTSNKGLASPTSSNKKNKSKHHA